MIRSSIVHVILCAIMGKLDSELDVRRIHFSGEEVDLAGSGIEVSMSGIRIAGALKNLS